MKKSIPKIDFYMLEMQETYSEILKHFYLPITQELKSTCAVLVSPWAIAIIYMTVFGK